jgi:hypothetical protein
MRYIKKPIAIDAVQFTDPSLATMDKIAEFMDGAQAVLHGAGEPKIEIPTLEGVITASLGDYIIKGVSGEFYPCNPDIFEKAYVSEDEVGTLSDGYHTFDELYEFRKMYNAAAFNAWSKAGLYDVHKSKHHSDGIPCYGGKWFIVMAILPTGQVSNHYKMEDWDLFQCPEELLVKFPYDGHTAQDVLNRLEDAAKKGG